MSRYVDSKFVDESPVTLGRPTLDVRTGFAEEFSLFRFLFTFRDAAFVLVVKRLRNGGRAPLVGEAAHLYFPLCGTVINLEHVAGFYSARRFDTFTVQADFSTVDSIGRHRSGFKETGSPKPFINSYGV